MTMNPVAPAPSVALTASATLGISFEQHGSGTTVPATAPNGMMLPVQALTTGFVHEVLSATPVSAAVQAGRLEAASAASSLLGVGESSLMRAPTGSVPTERSRNHAAVDAEEMDGSAVGQSRQGVRIGRIGMMLGYQDSSELTEMPDLYYLPNAPQWMKGLVNLRGNLFPVFDVAAYFDVESEKQQPQDEFGERDKDMLLILGRGEDAAGIMIKGIPQRLAPLKQQQTDIDTAPARVLPHIQDAYFMDGQLWFDVNCSSLLDLLEQEMKRQG